MEENVLDFASPSVYQTMDESLEVIFFSMISQGDVQNAVDFIRSIDINFLPSKKVMRSIIFDVLMKTEDVQCVGLASDYLVTILNVYPPSYKNRQFYYESIQGTHGFFTDLWLVFRHIGDSYFYYRGIYIIDASDSHPDPIKYPNCKFLLEFYVKLFALDLENYCFESPCLMMKLLWPNGNMCLSTRTEYLLKWINDIYSSTKCLNIMGDLLEQMHELLALMVKCMTQRNSNTLDSAAFCNPSVAEIVQAVINFCKGAFTSLKHVKMFLSMISFKYFQARVSEKIIKQVLKHSSKRNILTLKDIVDQCMFPKKVKFKNNKPSSNKEKSLRKRSIDRKTVAIDKKIRTTKLHELCKKNMFGDLLQKLQLSCEDVNARDHSGCTPMHIACQVGSVLCVNILLEECVKAPFMIDLTIANAEGDTPLHIAVKENAISIAEQLLRSGGSDLLTIANFQGLYPNDLSNSEEMNKVLQDYNSDSTSVEQETVEDRVLEAPIFKSFKECSIYLHALNCLLCCYCNIFNLCEFVWKKNNLVLSHSDKMCCHYTDQGVCSEDAGLVLELPCLIKTFMKSICKHASKYEYNIDIELIPLRAFVASLES